MDISLIRSKTIVGLMVGMALSFALNLNFVHADDVVDDIVITVPEVCTLSSQTGTGETYVVSMNAGQYKNDIGDTRLSVSCNDAGGFSIYAIGFSDNTLGNNKMITNDPNTYIATGTATSGSTSNWAMKLTAVASTGPGVYTPIVQSPFTSFSAVPASYTKVVTVNPAVDSGTSAQVDATYAVFVSASQVAGTYTGKVKYTIVHPTTEVPQQPQDTPAGYIGYFPNTSSVTDTMGNQSASANASVTLWASNFQRPGYGFVGWSDAYDYVANEGSESNPNAHIYGPNEDITTPSDLATKGLSLYAVWVKSAGNLQNFTCPNNTVMPIGKVTALTDSRDNNTYAVAKLADGNCWMIENLRLAGVDSSSNPIVLSSTNTNSPSLPLTNTGGTTSNSLSPSTDPASTAWCNTNSSACVDQSMIYTGNTTNPVSNMTDPETNIYSYGNYYNWYSATAGNGEYSTATDTNTSGDICPANWHLPRGGDKAHESTNDFWALVVDGINGGVNPANYNNSQPYYSGSSEAGPVYELLRSYPNNFLVSGAVSGSMAHLGMIPSYWSSTAAYSNQAYRFVFGDMSVFPGDGNNNKYGGFVVRCVAGS